MELPVIEYYSLPSLDERSAVLQSNPQKTISCTPPSLFIYPMCKILVSLNSRGSRKNLFFVSVNDSKNNVLSEFLYFF